MSTDSAYPPKPVIAAQDILKSYGDVRAVCGISFEVHKGECFGLLGPNGAGKTTTMSLIRCVTHLNGGRLLVLGRDVSRQGRSIRYRLGVVPQIDSLDVDLSVRDNLLTYASYFAIRVADARRRAEELLHFMALQEKAEVKIEELSGGMRRRLLLARGLINDPEVLILDEPTTGLDPQARHHIWQRLRSLKTAGTTMILCTHAMDEAEQLCDRVAIIDHGRILDVNNPQALIRKHAGFEVLALQDVPTDPLGTKQTLDALPWPADVRRESYESSCFAFSFQPEGFPADFVPGVRALGLPLTLRKPTLEDVFLNLTGRELRE